MELEELEVPELRPDLMGEGPSVGSGNARVGCDRIQLPHPARGQDYGWGLEHLACLTSAQEGHSDNPPPVDHQTGDLGVLQNLYFSMVMDDLRQAADERGTGAVSSGVNDSGVGVGRFQSQPEPAFGAAIELGSQGQQFINPVGTFVCEDAYCLGIGQPVARGEGVRGMLAWAIPRSQGDGDTALS